MKRCIYILIVLLVFGCSSLPKDFTYRYDGINTGLDALINIDGYYVSEHGCDSAFYSVYMFYPDGLFTIATVSKVSDELIDCFAGRDSNIYKYPSWGIYRVENGLIRTQVLRAEGNRFTIFRDYRILPDGNIVNISDFVKPEYSRLGYLKNYPSFLENSCEKPAVFYPLNMKREKKKGPFRF